MPGGVQSRAWSIVATGPKPGLLRTRQPSQPFATMGTKTERTGRRGPILAPTLRLDFSHEFTCRVQCWT
jgi:hypothetical protein